MTLDEVLAAGMPAGSSIWHCPLCEWVHAQPPPDPFAPVSVPEVPGATLSECTGSAAAAILAEWYGEAETAIKAHMSGHPLIEWAREVIRLREVIDLTAIALSGSGRIGATVDAIAGPGSELARILGECRERL